MKRQTLVAIPFWWDSSPARYYPFIYVIFHLYFYFFFSSIFLIFCNYYLFCSLVASVQFQRPDLLTHWQGSLPISLNPLSPATRTLLPCFCFIFYLFLFFLFCFVLFSVISFMLVLVQRMPGIGELMAASYPPANTEVRDVISNGNWYYSLFFCFCSALFSIF